MIAVVTGGRSDAGILAPLIEELKAEVIDLSPTVEAHSYADTPLNIAWTSGEVAKLTALKIDTLGIDKLVVLGDRFEALAAAIAAYDMGVTIIHLHGGEVTSGSRDDSRRNALTCLADVHLVATERAANRVRDFGKRDVHVVGSIGAYNARNAIPAVTDTQVIVAVPADPEVHAACVEATAHLNPFIVGPNADLGHSRITGESLPAEDFLSLLKAAKVIVGNSSCGIIEAPSAGTRTVNVGDRQKGRERAVSVVDVACDVDAIRHAVDVALWMPPFTGENPYEHGDPVSMAAAIIRSA